MASGFPILSLPLVYLIYHKLLGGHWTDPICLFISFSADDRLPEDDLHLGHHAAHARGGGCRGGGEHQGRGGDSRHHAPSHTPNSLSVPGSPRYALAMTTVCKNITVAITEQLLLDPPHCWLLIENAQEPVEVTRWGPIRQHCKNRDCELASGQETKLSDAIHCC